MGGIDDQTKEKYKIIYELIAANYDLSYIKKLLDFQKKYPNDRDLYWRSQVWIATTYEMNEKHAEALPMYDRLLNNADEIGSAFEGVFIRALRLFAKAGQREKSRGIFWKHIQSDRIQPFTRLTLLSWFVQTFDSADDEIENFRPFVSSLATKLGVWLDGVEIKDDIVKLEKIQLASTTRDQKFWSSIRTKNKSEKISLIKQYIQSNPIPYYREAAKKALDALDHGEE